MPTLTLADFPRQSAEQAPDAPAFRFSDQSLTYAELCARSGQMAGVLRDLGVSKGDCVGVCLERSLETAIALYGVIAAGAVWVPIDPDAPVTRIGRIAQMAAIDVMIADDLTAAKVFETAATSPRQITVIGPDPSTCDSKMGWRDLTACPQAPWVPVSSDDPGYVIFTSGSTGQPKGILHTHASGCAYATAAAHLYDVKPGACIANHAPSHFDISLFGLLSAPYGGATTAILTRQHAFLPASLAQWIEQQRITHWYSIPNAIHNLVVMGNLEGRDFSALRWIKFGGEPFSNARLAQIMRAFPGATFSHSYGPSEVNQCTYQHFNSLPPENQMHPEIGRAFEACQMHIVDADDRPIAPGQQGELLVHGPSTMREYIGDPERTATAFAHIPNAQGEPLRFYRTGDMVSSTADGILSFHGRMDRQIKLRGYRIELDEIEEVLMMHQDVLEAAAWVRKDNEDISAAVILHSGRDPLEAEILGLASAHLAPYAVPRHLHMLDRFPRTGSGKVDRIALAAQMTDAQGAG